MSDSVLLNELMRRSRKAPADHQQQQQQQRGAGENSAAVGAWPRDAEMNRPETSTALHDDDDVYDDHEGRDAGVDALSESGDAVILNYGHTRQAAHRDDGEHLRYLHSTAASTSKQMRKKRPPGYDSPDANLEPVERLIRELSPKHLHPAPRESAR